jgi:Ca-activated chloride channel family protein
VAQLASNAGVHVSTIGVGTPEGSVIEVDGYQMATALDEDMLTQISTTTGGTYQRAENAAELDQIYRSIDLRTKTIERKTEITGVIAAGAVVLMMAAGLLMTRWFGRIV